MNRSILTIAAISSLAVAVAGTPARALAQNADGEKPAVEKKEAPKGEKKNRAIPFKGKVAAIDKKAMTFKVAERTFAITAETRLMRNGKSALLEDVAVGDEVRGSYQTGPGGKLEVQTVHFGPKPEAESKDTVGKEKKTNE